MILPYISYTRSRWLNTLHILFLWYNNTGSRGRRRSCWDWRRHWTCCESVHRMYKFNMKSLWLRQWCEMINLFVGFSCTNVHSPTNLRSFHRGLNNYFCVLSVFPCFILWGRSVWGGLYRCVTRRWFVTLQVTNGLHNGFQVLPWCCRCCWGYHWWSLLWELVLDEQGALLSSCCFQFNLPLLENLLLLLLLLLNLNLYTHTKKNP